VEQVFTGSIALSTNIRLGQKWLAVSYTLAYSVFVLITAAKRFKAQASVKIRKELPQRPLSKFVMKSKMSL